LKNTGYEIRIRSARYLAKLSCLTGMVILLLELQNAFIRVDRAFLLEFVMSVVAEIAGVL